MKRLIWGFAFAACLARGGNSQQPGNKPPLIVVHRPTVVAFFLPISEAEANRADSDAEALSDFHYYAYREEKRLKMAGIDLTIVSGRSFKFRDGARIWNFQTGKIGIGYYLIAPGKMPHVEYGVMTDEDLCAAAEKYFRVKISKEPCQSPHCSK